MRIKLDFREVSSNEDHDCCLWMYIDRSISTVRDLLMKIKSDCDLSSDLKVEDIDLYLEQFLLPQRGSIKLIKDSELLTLKFRKNKILKLQKTQERSLSNKDEKRSTGHQLLVPHTESTSTSVKPAGLSGIKSNLLLDETNSIKLSVEENSQPSNVHVSPESIRSIKVGKHKHILQSRLQLSESKSNSPTISEQSQILGQSFITSTLSNTKIKKAFWTNARKNRYMSIVDSLNDYGKPWKIDQKYEDFMSFQCGTPDNLWLYAWTPSLVEIDDVVQVTILKFWNGLKCNRKTF